jgi:hypothetical protein
MAADVRKGAEAIEPWLEDEIGMIERLRAGGASGKGMGGTTDHSKSSRRRSLLTPFVAQRPVSA